MRSTSRALQGAFGVFCEQCTVMAGGTECAWGRSGDIVDTLRALCGTGRRALISGCVMMVLAWLPGPTHPHDGPRARACTCSLGLQKQ
eukprot:9187303-Alexandrium_andersonii.AAC.1